MLCRGTRRRAAIPTPKFVGSWCDALGGGFGSMLSLAVPRARQILSMQGTRLGDAFLALFMASLFLRRRGLYVLILNTYTLYVILNT